MKKLILTTIAALLWEATAIAYDPAAITSDDLKILKEFDRKYYELRRQTAKKADITNFTRWCWENMRLVSLAGQFDIGIYTEKQEETDVYESAQISGVYGTYHPTENTSVKLSRNTAGKTRLDLMANLGIFDASEAKREDEKIRKDKLAIAVLVGEIASLRSELILLDVDADAHHLEELRLKARSKSGVIAEDIRLDHLSKTSEKHVQIAKKEADYESKIMQLETYIRGDRLDLFYTQLKKL